MYQVRTKDMRGGIRRAIETRDRRHVEIDRQRDSDFLMYQVCVVVVVFVLLFVLVLFLRVSSL